MAGGNFHGYMAKRDGLIRLLHITIEEASSSYARVSMPFTPDVQNALGIAHGGAIFALADVAFGVATNAEQKNFVVSLSTHITFLRAGSVGPLVAEAKLVRAGGHILNYLVQVFDGRGECLAQCQSEGYVTRNVVEGDENGT